MEEILPGDVIGYMISLMFSELTTPRLTEMMSTDILVSYHSLQYVSKSMYALCQHALKTLAIDWVRVISKMSRPTHMDWSTLFAEEKEEKKRTSLVKMIRTQLYCGAQLSLIRKELDVFRRLHHIVCYSEKTGKPRNDHVSLSKLKRIKVEPRELDGRYRAIIKRYETTKKKEKLLHDTLVPIRSMLIHKSHWRRLALIGHRNIVLVGFMRPRDL